MGQPKRGVLKIRLADGWVSIPSIGPQGETGPSFAAYRREGASKPELWYISHHIVSVGFLQGNPTAVGEDEFRQDRLYVIPFIIDNERIIEQMCLWSYNWNKSNKYYARFGIYQDTGNMYPGDLIQDFGETTLQFAPGRTVAGICPVNVDMSFSDGIYWLAVVIDNVDNSTSDSGFVAGFNSGSVLVGINPLGIPLSELNTRQLENEFSFTCYWRPFDYYDSAASPPRYLRTLPDPFTSGLAVKSADLFPKKDNCPIIFVKLSSIPPPPPDPDP
jgi:hypothetical protein